MADGALGGGARAERRRAAGVTAALVLAVFAFATLADRTEFYYDALDYWRLSDFFGKPIEAPHAVPVVGPVWDFLLGFPVFLRGYLFPLLLRLARVLGRGCLGSELAGFRLLSSLNAVVFIALLLPALFGIRPGSGRWAAGACLSTALLVLFWRDLILYPLSDLPALAMYTAVLLLLRRLAAGCRTGRGAAAAALGAGALAYGAYNIRTVYLIPLAAAFAFYAVQALRRRVLPARLPAAVLGLALGFCAAALPQMLINAHNYAVASPAVFTGVGEEGGLILPQLKWGIWMHRYETFVGDAALYPTPRVQFIDPVGQRLAGSAVIDGLGDFVLFLLRHPFSACRIYLGHLFSAFTLFYDRIYLQDLTVSLWVFWGNCLVCLAALPGLWAAASAGGWRCWGRSVPALTLFWLPALLALPGAVEVRYFFPVYATVYLFLTMGLDWRAAARRLRRRWYAALPLAALLLAGWYLAANALLGTVEYGALTLGGYIPPQ